MEHINYYNTNDIKYIYANVSNYIKNLDKATSPKYLYVYGDIGIGKTTIINSILTSLKYNINYIDCNQNKLSVDELINMTNISDVYSMFFNNKQNNALIIDNINYYSYSDKSYFTNLIKLLKKKNSHKPIPFIFINTLQEEKKFTELYKISTLLKINPPSNSQLKNIILKLYPSIFELENSHHIVNNILDYLDNKFYKLINIHYFYNNNIIELKFNSPNASANASSNIINNSNIKLLTKNLLEHRFNLNDLDIINYSDRTSLSLLLHENIIKLFNTNLTSADLKIYKKILQNFAFCDCIDKNIFLYQIWQLNDITYIIKIFYNNFILYQNNLLKHIDQKDIIFTKILTKYSSEYNNFNFIFSNTQLYCTNKKNLLLHMFVSEKYDETHIKLVYNRIIKLIEQYINYKINNSYKILEENIDVNCDDFFY
jgi:hypothetical protein|uniref:ATPase AAA-type core domain-containing protein n=1 Tax=viral metagenome TaxID=1070528 RepID=A0A6C0KRN2_9ZZZZ